MTKYVIDTVELKKRQYVIDAFSEREAIDKMEDAEPRTTEIMSDNIFGIRTINEYEFKKTYQPQQREMFEESNDIWRDD